MTLSGKDADHPGTSDTSLPIWPLPASAFEHYMCLDDRPSHPMASFLEVDLRGPVTAEQFQQALPAALHRHPLLNSILQRTPRGRSVWIASPHPPACELLAADAPLPIPPVFDLHSQPGLQCWFRPREGGATVILSVHHATCDALGMLTFFMDWLCLATGNAALLPATQLAALPQREDLRATTATFPLRQRLRNIVRYLAGTAPRPLSLATTASPSATCRPDSAYHVVRFSAAESQTLRDATRQAGVSLNDWLIAALLLTIAKVEQAPTAPMSGQLSSAPWRLLIPVNRRKPDEKFSSACNRIGYKMLTRSPAETADFPELLHQIHREMAPIRRHPQGVYSFLKMLRLFQRFGLLHRTVRKYDCFATVILSNLGDVGRYFAPLLQSSEHVLRVGDVEIDGIRCAPPRRPHTHLSLVALTYHNELQLISSRLGPGLNDQATLEFLLLLRETIQKTVSAAHK